MATDVMTPSLVGSGSSSPLSSLGSQSPPMPSYFLPPIQPDLPGIGPPAMKLDASERANDGDGPPPAKKRRTIGPKIRVTQYLDLPSADSSAWTERGYDACPAEQKKQLDLLLKVLHKKRKVVVVAGAGISVSAGIPDFRSKTGLFNNVQEHHPIKASGKHLFDASVYRTDAATSMFHDMVRSLARLAEASKPTAFHQLLAKVAEEGRLLRLYSQNVDGLDIALPPLRTNVPLNAKAPWPRTIQLHGGLGKMVCQKCGHVADFEAALFEGPQPPPCHNCLELDSLRTTVAGKRSHGVGRLRPRIVLYNEHNPDEEAIGAVTRCDLRSRPDALVVVGTSLRVRGVRRIVKEMCRVVRGRRDGITVWINNGFRPVGRDFEGCWDLIVNGDADVVARLAGWPAREPSESNAGEEVDDDDWAEMKGRDSPVVVVTSPKKPKPRKDQMFGEGAVPAMGKLAKKNSSGSSATLNPDGNDASSMIKLVLRPPMEPIRGTMQPKQEVSGDAKASVPATKQQQKKKEEGSNTKKPIAGAKQPKKEAGKEAADDAKKPPKLRKAAIMKAKPTLPLSSTKISAVFKATKARSDSAAAGKQKMVDTPLST